MVANGGRFCDPAWWGFITAGPTTASTLALAAAPIAGTQRYTITAFNHLEELSLDWMAELCQLHPEMKGVYVSGGSVANLVGLGAARQAVLERLGHDPARDGLPGDLTLRVYTSTEAHHTVQRSAAVLGLGRRAVVAVPCDNRQRIDVVALDATIQADIAKGTVPLAVVANAGTTNTGAIDPIEACADVAATYGAWLHVDGAYGLFGVLDDRLTERYAGLQRADSVIVDPHKWLNTPVGVSATYVRDRELLFRAFTQEPADYLEGSFDGTADGCHSVLDSMGIPYGDFGVELSAPSRGVAVWMALREIGAEGVTTRIRFDNDLARHLAQAARHHPCLELLSEPELSVVCFRYCGPPSGEGHPGYAGDLDDLNRELLRDIHRQTPLHPELDVGPGAVRPSALLHQPPHDGR